MCNLDGIKQDVVVDKSRLCTGSGFELEGVTCSIPNIKLSTAAVLFPVVPLADVLDLPYDCVQCEVLCIASFSFSQVGEWMGCRICNDGGAVGTTSCNWGDDEQSDLIVEYEYTYSPRLLPPEL